MKKKRIIFLVATLLAVCLAFTGCAATGSFSKVDVKGVQDTAYTVYGNGGNAVQYGNYIYFINGTKGYEDADQKQNIWGKVVKGALYRAELSGAASTDVSGDFDIAINKDALYTDGLEFVSHVAKDYDENDVDIVDVQLIAPKVIGTSGYNEGGLFLFGEWIYYGTPNNERDKKGVVQTAKTDFMRTKLDGTKTQKIYTTDADSASSPYAFYCFGDKVYLNCFFDSKVISVEVGKSKIGKPVTLAQNVTGALLPYNTTYKKGINTNTMQDFIYILREAGSDDNATTGRAIEVLRPYPVKEETEGFKFYFGGKETTLEAVRDGMLFYRVTDSFGTQQLKYDNLHAYFMQWSPSYKAYQQMLDGLNINPDNGAKLEDINIYNQGKVDRALDGTLPALLSSATGTYCFRPGGLASSEPYALVTDTAGAYLIRENRDTMTFYEAEMKISFVEKEYVYFTDKEGKILYRTAWEKAAAVKTSAEKKEQVSHTEMVDNGLRADFCAGYIVYMAKADEYTQEHGYAFFKKVDSYEIAGEGVMGQVFVGEKIEADIKPEDEEEDTEDEEEKKGCGSALVVNSVGGGTKAIIALMVLGTVLLMAYRPKKARKSVDIDTKKV